MHNYLANLKSPQPRIRTASIVGARGYAGLELVQLLLNHPFIDLKYAFATNAFQLTTDSMDERAARILCLPESEILNYSTDIVFLATPAEVSLKLTPAILKLGSKVIDLSGVFRLKENDYQKWYGFSHTQPDLLAKAHYGLQNFAGKTSSDLISNPGCYATAIALALIPLFKRGLVSSENIVIDAKSGTSGAGRKAQENLLFSEVVGECLPYRVGRHQHLPEIQESIAQFSGVQIEPHFSTSLLATSRGIIAAIYLNSITDNLKDIERALQDEYSNYGLVRTSSKISQFASLKKVVGTPFTHISYELVGKKLYLFSCIDNLMKGAASQAIENLNQILDLPCEFSLIPSSENNPSTQREQEAQT